MSPRDQTTEEMPSLAILIPLYPSLCVLFSSLLMIYLYRRSIRHAYSRFSRTCLIRKNRNYTRLSDRNEVELESGFELDELGAQSEDEDEEGLYEHYPGDEPDTDTDTEEASPTPNPNPKTSTRSRSRSRIPSPLSLYFNAQTALIHPHLLSPTAPPTPGWERRLRRRIDEGRGLGAWKDRLAERTMRWLLSFSP